MVDNLTKKENVSKLVTSSGGNAGYSVALAGFKIGVSVDVFVPSTTLPLMINKMRSVDANVVIAGNNWNEADAQARIVLAKNSNARYIPPFDDPLIWEGHRAIVKEMFEELGMAGMPSTIVLSVGGGGLLRGVQLELEALGLANRTRIIAVETEGAASFAAAKTAGKVVRLEKISTIASTLGALAVIPSVLVSPIRTDSLIVSDSDAVNACLKFAEHQRILVEPACGAALAVAYDAKFSHLLERNETVAVIVCGGSAVDVDLLLGWKKQFSL